MLIEHICCPARLSFFSFFSFFFPGDATLRAYIPGRLYHHFESKEAPIPSRVAAGAITDDLDRIAQQRAEPIGRSSVDVGVG